MSPTGLAAVAQQFRKARGARMRVDLVELEPRGLRSTLKTSFKPTF